MKTNSTELHTIAKWFGIPDNFVDMPKGRGAFLGCVQYLTHEQEKQQEQGKTLYEDSKIKANFDFRAELDKRDEMKAKWGKKGDSMTDKQIMGQRIMLDGLTLLQANAEDPILYADNLEFFRKVRGVYLSDLTPPKARLNYYICGDAGAGKGVMSKALARAMFPELENDEEIFFEVGADKALFEGYDGQPVIIWNDRRAGNLIKKLGSRSNVYNVFDTHPTKQKQNVKYSSVGLVNSVNIVNSVQPYMEFLETLAGGNDEDDAKNEDDKKSQAYRRFPLIINVHPEEFDLYINKGFLSQTETYLDYEAHKSIYGNMRKIAEKCSQYKNFRRQIEGVAIKPIIDQHNRLKANNKPLCEQSLEEIMSGFSGYGKQLLDLFKTQEQLNAQREKHKKVKTHRDTGLLDLFG